MSDSIKCPFCAEEIKSDAKKCRYCGEWLVAPPVSPANITPTSPITTSMPPAVTNTQAKSTDGCAVLLLLVGMIAVFGGGFAWMQGYTLDSLAAKPHEVTLSASGTASKVLVTYTNAQGGTEQLNSVTLPWNKSFTAKSGDTIVFIASNHSDSGDITAEILIDGLSVKKSESSGPGSNADCSVTVP